MLNFWSNFTRSSLGTFQNENSPAIIQAIFPLMLIMDNLKGTNSLFSQ